MQGDVNLVESCAGVDGTDPADEGQAFSRECGIVGCLGICCVLDELAGLQANVELPM